MDRDQATPKEMDRERLRQQEAVDEEKKELGEKFEDVYTCRGVASQLSYHFDVVKLILRIRGEKHHSCERIQPIPTAVWEKIK
jgi:uncharacterized protein (UPF0335 family)